MSEDHLEREVLGRVSMNRRSFIKKVVVGTVFAVPVIASFDMLAMGTATGVPPCTTPNGTTTAGGGTSGSGLQGGAGGTSGVFGGTGAAGGAPNGGCGGAGGVNPAVRPKRRTF
jgi:hypothetical protein